MAVVPADDLPSNMVPSDDLPSNLVPSEDLPSTEPQKGALGRVSAPSGTFESYVKVPASRLGAGGYVLPSERKQSFKDYMQGASAGVPGFFTGLANIPLDVYNAAAKRVAAENAYREAIRKGELPLQYGAAPELGAKAPTVPTLPTTSQFAEMYGPATSEEQKKRREIGGYGGEFLTGLGAAELASLGAKGVRGLKSLYDVLRGTEGEAGIESLASKLKSGEIETSIVPQRGVTPQDIRTIQNEINAADADLVGQTSLDKIKSNVDALQKQRQSLAAKTYGAARYSMDARTAAGDVFQESEPGKQLISYFKNKITPVDGQIAVSEVEEREINGILRDLVGKTERVEPSPILSESGEPMTPATTKTSYSSPDVLRELLRRLRDRSNGSIAEGYSALSQQRAGEFADKLANSLGEWDGQLAQADKLYKEQSELLHPTRTTRGKFATKREKYDMNEWSADPKSLPPKFFTSRQGVEQFTDLVGGNKALVEEEAEKFALSQLKNKTPEGMRSWFNQAQNAGWLNYDTLPQTTANIAKRIYGLEYQQVAKPITDVMTDFSKGIIKAEELPAKLRSAVSGKDYPSEPVKRLMSEVDKIEKSTDKTQAARSLAMKIGLLAGLPTAGAASAITYYRGR